MKIFIDDKELEVFSGAVIADILRLFSEEEYDNVNSGRKSVYDEYENIVNLDGAVSSNSKYFIREK